jgi:signal recognition particle subunit SRP54
MTMKERRNPEILNNSRKQRIARGSGVTVNEVTSLLKKFDQMRVMMQKMMHGGKGAKMPGMLPKGAGGMGGLGGLGGLGGFGGMGDMSGAGGSGRSATKKKRDIKKERAKRKNKKR